MTNELHDRLRRTLDQAAPPIDLAEIQNRALTRPTPTRVSPSRPNWPVIAGATVVAIAVLSVVLVVRRGETPGGVVVHTGGRGVIRLDGGRRITGGFMAAGRLWLGYGTPDGRYGLQREDLVDERPGRKIVLPGELLPQATATSGGHVWLATVNELDGAGTALLRLDPRSGAIRKVATLPSVAWLTASRDRLWVKLTGSIQLRDSTNGRLLGERPQPSLGPVGGIASSTANSDTWSVDANTRSVDLLHGLATVATVHLDRSRGPASAVAVLDRRVYVGQGAFLIVVSAESRTVLSDVAVGGVNPPIAVRALNGVVWTLTQSRLIAYRPSGGRTRSYELPEGVGTALIDSGNEGALACTDKACQLYSLPD